MCLVRRFPTSEQLYLVITDEQLLGLEDIRGHGGIDFQFDISATLSNGNHAGPDWFSTQARYAVTPGRWLELLDQVGAATTITVRVPSPFTDAAPDGNALAPPRCTLATPGRKLRRMRPDLSLSAGQPEGVGNAQASQRTERHESSESRSGTAVVGAVSRSI